MNRSDNPEKLTTREWEVLALVHDGLTNDQIAERLGITRDGVKYHVSNILSKLHLSDRREAAGWYGQATRKRQPAIVLIGFLRKKWEDASPSPWPVGLGLGAGLVALFALAFLFLGRGSGGHTPAIDSTPVLNSDALDVKPAPAPPEAERREEPPAPMQAPRYVTVWDLPDVPVPTPVSQAEPPIRGPNSAPPQHSSAVGTEAILPAVLQATLEGNAQAVRRAAALGPGSATLYDLESDQASVCETLNDLCFWVLPLLSNEDGEFWAVVSSGRAFDAEGQPYPQFVAVFKRLAGGSWSDELARASLTPPGDGCCGAELGGVAWPQRGGTGVLTSAPGSRLTQGILSLPVMTPEQGEEGWLFLQGLPYMATSASVFYGLRFDPVETRLDVMYSKLHRRWAGELRDLNGDGLPEVVINEGNAYAFSGASGIDEQSMRLLRWSDGDLVEVELAVPSGIPIDVAGAVDEALAFAEAGLWLDARASIASAAARASESDDLQWLARRIDLVASARLDQAARALELAEDRNQRYDHDVLIAVHVMAGDYDAALAHLQSLPLRETWLPGSGFKPNGNPLPDPMTVMAGGHILDYTNRALEVVPTRAAVHALRALGLVLSHKPDYAAAADEMAIAVELDPSDAFFAEVLDALRIEAGR